MPPLGEATPGPLIMVVQFVAFLGAFRDPGALDPWVAAVLGALLTTWVTFVPCSLFIRSEVPVASTLRPGAAVLAVVAAVLVFRLRWSVLRTLGSCAGPGLAAGSVGLVGA